jgi:hypothetical protein
MKHNPLTAVCTIDGMISQHSVVVFGLLPTLDYAQLHIVIDSSNGARSFRFVFSTSCPLWSVILLEAAHKKIR